VSRYFQGQAMYISDPNMDPFFFAKLSAVGINMKTYKPPVEDIRARHYEKYRQGGKLEEADEEGVGLVIDLACEELVPEAETTALVVLAVE
jgi:hypothetical protein